MSKASEVMERLLQGEQVEWVKLGDIAKLERGTSITRQNSEEGCIPVISGGRTPSFYTDQHNREGRTITIAGSGVYAGFVAYWEQPIFVNDAFSIKTDENINIKYVFYFLLKSQLAIYRLKKGAGIPHVYPKDLARFLIPIPPLHVQQEIVDKLDRFNALANSITEGLPREIELRQQQYEYYRDLLLDFPNAA